MTNILLLFISLLFISQNAVAKDGCSHDCKQCHTISEKEAAKVLANHGNPKIVDIRMSPVKGLWQVMAVKDNVKNVYYIDFEKKNVVIGAIIDSTGKVNLTREAVEKATVFNIADIKQTNALILGKEGAKIKVYVMTDPTCFFCSNLHKEMKELLKNHPEISFNILLFPSKGSKESYDKAKTIICSPTPLKLLEDSFAKKSIPPVSCNTKVIDENIALGKKYGITGTPTIIFPNGRVHFGTEEKRKLLSLILQNLK